LVGGGVALKGREVAGIRVSGCAWTNETPARNTNVEKRNGETRDGMTVDQRQGAPTAWLSQLQSRPALTFQQSFECASQPDGRRRGAALTARDSFKTSDSKASRSRFEARRVVRRRGIKVLHGRAS
jgi:hypothetical protein